VGRGTDLSDLHLPIRLNGDLAFFQAVGKLLVEWDAVDPRFAATHTEGFEEWLRHVRQVDLDQVTRETGLSRDQITAAARMAADSGATVYCWKAASARTSLTFSATRPPGSWRAWGRARRTWRSKTS
jgi:anaerobic selenocysteine-containing dehydrogenase